MMVSERLMVERRWAMLMVVLFPLRRAASALLTSVSDSASRAEVAEIVVSQKSKGGECKESHLHRGSGCQDS